MEEPSNPLTLQEIITMPMRICAYPPCSASFSPRPGQSRAQFASTKYCCPECKVANERLQDRARKKEIRKPVDTRAAMERAEEMASAHWGYIDKVLKVHGVADTTVIGHHYRTAFIHGYKHALEDLNGNGK